jgi:hypothetical protein
LLNVTVAVFAALLPLMLNVGVAPPGPDNIAHVYVSPFSPASSAPSTLSVADNPVTVPGPLAGVTTVGTLLLTVTTAVPFTPPALAVIVADPAVLPAVYTPAPLTLPTPLRLHENAGCVAIAAPN